jgi:ribosomal protein S18 acetylase RimI-like enzyme
MKITLRHGSSLDDIICQDLMRLALDDTAIADPANRSSTENLNRFQLAKLGGRRLIASVDTRDVAFVDYLIAKQHIKYLFVHPRYQRKGIGAELLNAAQEHIKDIISVNVLCINERAVLWYLGRGFKVSNCWLERFNGKQTAWLKLTRANVTLLS